MKKNFTLLLLFVSLIFVPGCRKNNLFTPTTFTLNTTEVISEGEERGYFFANGDPTVSGTFIMQIDVEGDSLHCSQTLTTPKRGNCHSF